MTLLKDTYYAIHAMTGCTCCNDRDHYRGLYYTKEDAERRIQYYLSESSKYWPLASQFAKRGRYDVRQVEVEEIGDGRVIIGDKVFDSFPKLISVFEDGRVIDDKDEEIYGLEYA